MSTRSSVPGRLTALAVLVVAALALLAGPALAHASLRATAPADGAVVDASPETIRFEFDEPVEVPPGGIRIHDQQGERVAVGQPVVGTSGSTSEGFPVTVPVPQPLGSGTYVVTYRVVSADGHPINGAFVFSVGAAAGIDDDLVASLVAGDGGAVVSVLATLDRAAVYTGVLLAAGAVLFTFLVARDDHDHERARTWARRGAVVGLIAALGGVPLQAMATTGYGPLRALSPDVVGPTLASGFGAAVGLQLGALALLAGLTRRGPVRWGPAAVVALVALASFVVAGHTRTTDPAWLIIAADAVHVVAAAAWFGGLAVLASSLRGRRLADDPVGGARLVAGFSRMATWSVVAVAVAGSAMAWTLVRVPRALTSTTYGWTLLAKVALVGLVVLAGAYNQRRLVPLVAAAVRRDPRRQPTAAGQPIPAGGANDAPDDRALRVADLGWRRLRRTVRYEALALVGVLAVTGFLVYQRPAAKAAGVTGAYQAETQLTQQLEVELVVDPNRAGANQIHLYILDRTGRPARDIAGLTMKLSLPARDIGPIVREPPSAGPGHWVLAGNELSIPGEWAIEVIVALDRFTEESATFPVVVNP